MTFAKDFHKHMAAPIRAACASQGFLVACGSRGFRESYDAVMRLAVSRGALLLDTSAFEKLEDHIATLLLAAIITHELKVAEHRIMTDRVSADVDKHMRRVENYYERKLAAGG